MWLIIGDLHFTDHARDQYRFGIFKWIRQQQEKYKPVATFLLGDLTDAKDRHSALLVNKIVNGLMSLEPPVYILEGNHDYKADKRNPFFKFLNHIEGLRFVTEPTVIKAVLPIALIPHCRSQDDWNNAVKMVFGGRTSDSPACLLAHQTFVGAIAESGVRLSGLSASLVESFNPPLGVYAGDVHKPQTQGIVTYVGCPYQVRFGDNFNPRSIFIEDSGDGWYDTYDLEFAAPKKRSLTVSAPEDIEELYRSKCMERGDQVKLTIRLGPEELVHWKKIQRDILAVCKAAQLEVFGVKLESKELTRRKHVAEKQIEPSVILETFCRAEKIPANVKRVGMELLKDV